jgi:hypothetical protein
MRAAAKVGLVAGGYLGAVLVAVAVVAVYVAYTSGPDRDVSSGMYAFGDSLLFLAVFGLAAVPATGAALFFLRANRTFWRVLSIAALAIAATSLAALVEYVAAQGADRGSVHHSWSALAVLRILVAPLFALAFFLSCVFSPDRVPRIALLVASLVEATVFASVALLMFHPPSTSVSPPSPIGARERPMTHRAASGDRLAAAPCTAAVHRRSGRSRDRTTGCRRSRLLADATR